MILHVRSHLVLRTGLPAFSLWRQRWIMKTDARRITLEVASEHPRKYFRCSEAQKTENCAKEVENRAAWTGEIDVQLFMFEPSPNSWREGHSSQVQMNSSEDEIEDEIKDVNIERNHSIDGMCWTNNIFLEVQDVVVRPDLGHPKSPSFFALCRDLIWYKNS